MPAFSSKLGSEFLLENCHQLKRSKMLKNCNSRDGVLDPGLERRSELSGGADLSAESTI